MSQTCLKARPATANPANKFTVYLAGRSTALTPVQNEFRSDRVNKFLVHARSGHDFHSIKAGLPVLIKGWRRRDIESLVMPLLMSPRGENVLPKSAVPTVFESAHLEVGQLPHGKLAVDAMIHL